MGYTLFPRFSIGMVYERILELLLQFVWPTLDASFYLRVTTHEFLSKWPEIFSFVFFKFLFRCWRLGDFHGEGESSYKSSTEKGVHRNAAVSVGSHFSPQNFAKLIGLCTG